MKIVSLLSIDLFQISVFVSLVDVAVGVTSSAVGLIIMQELQKLKSTSQSSSKKENNMII